MSNLKQKVSYRVMALFMAVLMLVSMIPATVIAYALDSAESPYKATNFTATYNSENDAVDLSWDAFETEPYELWVCVDDVKTEKLDNSYTTYSIPTSVGGEQKFSLLAFVDEEDTEGVKSAEVAVEIANTFASVIAFDSEEVDNDLTITEIVAMLTTDAKVAVDENGTESVGHTVRWNTESVNYDQTASEEQTITIPGVVVLDKNVVQNRDNLSLDCSIEVKVKAAVDVAISSDLDDSAPIEKKVGETLSLSVEATGTAPEYQWYKKTAEETEGTIIDGATSATFNISSLALTDSSQYYCVITGKNNSTVTSKVATVNVAKNDVDLQLSISPIDGQTRPNPIDIEVLNVPADAKGTIQIFQGTKLIQSFELNGTNGEFKCSFVASGENNNYEFSATYSGDTDKYNGDEVAGVAYDFTKGSFTITEVKDIPSDIKALDEFKVTPVTELDPSSNAVVEYNYAVSDPSVAQIDENGNVTTLKKGEFKITVTALGNDDYNGDVFETDVIVVDYADRSGLSFNDDSIEKVYFSGFNYAGMEYTDNSNGDGDLVYSIVSAPSSDILIDQTGKIKYADSVDPFNKDMSNLIGDVKIRLTKQTDGVYKKIYAEYTLTIKIADQAALSFEKEKINVTYTADENGNALTTGQNVATGGSVNAPIVYSIISGNDVISLDPNDGSKFTAIKPGTAIVQAEKIGNTFFNKVSDTYTIVVEKGTVVGFDFDETNTDVLTTKYGVSFTNKAGNEKFGQTNSSQSVSYEIADVSNAIKDYAKVDALNGIVYFDCNYALAADSTEYSITIRATKAENEYYKEFPVVYTLKVTRADIDASSDFFVNGQTIKDATLLNNPNGWYNMENDNENPNVPDVVITPDGTKYVEISSDGKTWSSQIGLEVDEKHNVSFYLRAADGAVSLLTSQKINYDKTTATAKLTVVDDGDFWEKFLETITFGLWKNESKQILIEAQDNLSGIMSIEYYEQNNEFQDVSNEISIEDIVKDFEWKSCEITRDGLNASDTIKVDLEDLSNKKVVVYAKVTDCAGNVSYFRTNGMVFDNITPKQETELPEPIIEIELDENTSEGLYNSEVPFTLTVNDEQTDAVASGIKNIKVTIKGSDNENYEKVINIASTKSEISSFDSADINSDEFTVDNTFVVPAEFDSNYLTILVEVEDYAGNTYTNKDAITNLAIDKTIPVIEVTYNDTESTFSNKKYIGNNKNRVATIDITELNFDPSAVAITMSNDGKTLDIKPYFTAIEGSVDENGDQIGWRMTIDYATLGEGEFDFDIAYTDKATNANDGWIGDDIAVNKNFIIDNTKPIISVEITNADVKNDKYFAADRTATVTIIERNFSEDYKFDWSGLTFELDDAPLAAPTPVIIKNNNDTYERVYTIDFSAEGDYTFDVKYTDLADNLADTYSCSSVSYKEFTVDKTAPVLDITGVADKSANNGAVAPVITYSDINFNRDAVSIVLSGINNGTVNYNGGISAKDAHGQTYTYANFEKEQYVDDIYTLTAKLTDMAGNETEKVISFSVNRFGSVYDISNVKDIINSYLQNEQDIVFTETNVDSLEREGIIVKLTKNGTPITLTEGIDYTVSVTGGNGQWSVYTYTVNKALFADDGTYSISVYSVDAAGNVNENIDETKEAEISFGIDKTKPVVVPIDLESGKQYPVEGKEVSIEIKDNLVLEDVKIYLNGKEIEYTVEGEAYTFFIPESNNVQDVKVVATDAAGNEYELVVEDFLVSTNIFVRWFNNTPLFIGSIAGVVAIVLGVTAFILFGKKKKEDKDDAK